MINGLNHITVAVSDLSISFKFYTSLLGMKPEVKWETGAYLSASELWVCLSVDDKASPAKDYSHVAFSIDKLKFKSYCSRLLSVGVDTWKENTSEGNSLYILDPDGHKLEIHVGSLKSRLEELRDKPYKGMEWF